MKKTEEYRPSYANLPDVHPNDLILRVLYSDDEFVACLMRDGALLVARHDRLDRVRVVGPSADMWVEALACEQDRGVKREMCRRLTRPINDGLTDDANPKPKRKKPRAPASQTILPGEEV